MHLENQKDSVACFIAIFTLLLWAKIELAISQRYACTVNCAMRTGRVNIFTKEEKWNYDAAGSLLPMKHSDTFCFFFKFKIRNQRDTVILLPHTKLS